MSRSFIGLGQAQYIGIPFVRPITLEGRMGQVVPLSINWLAYGASSLVPNINVAVDLSINLVASKLRQIRSIYIDNMGSDNPIYVYFPSTDYAVVAQPNSAGWFRAYATDYQLQIIGEGFTTGDIPTTKVIVANIDVTPAVDIEISQSIELWKASATISRGSTIYNQNFGAPALGDQTIQFNDNLSVSGVFENNLWGTPLASGFIYLTHVDFSLTNINMLGAPNGSITVALESTGASGVLYSVAWGANFPASFNNVVDTQKMLNFSGMNIKLDATQTWRLRCLSVLRLTAQFCSAFNWTVNPT